MRTARKSSIGGNVPSFWFSPRAKMPKPRRQCNRRFLVIRWLNLMPEAPLVPNCTVAGRLLSYPFSIKRSLRNPKSGRARAKIESHRMKRPTPVTSCSYCRAPGNSIVLANGICGRSRTGSKCNGTNQSAVGKRAWKECKHCRATGWMGSSMCSHCDASSGWLFVSPSKVS